MFGYRLEGIGILTHGTLTEHLTGEQKIKIALTNHFAGDAKHHGMAVNAGVEISTVAIAGVLQHF